MRTTVSVLFLLLAASPALADEPPTPPTSPTSDGASTASPDVSIGVGARVSNFGAGGALELRLRTASELQVGVDASAG